MARTADDVEIIPVEGPGDLAAAMAIREVVFIEEQRVPEEIERDDEDPTAFHVLAQKNGHAIGTGRLVEMDRAPEGETGRWGQIGRMAVLVASRRGGIGSRILQALEAEAERRGLDGIKLHAQLHAHGFYEAAGYVNHGPIFQEAGMPHVEMRRRLRGEGARPRAGGKRTAGGAGTDGASDGGANAARVPARGRTAVAAARTRDAKPTGVGLNGRQRQPGARNGGSTRGPGRR